MSDVIPVRRALVSVSDRSGLDDLGAELARRGVEIVSTGGTARTLRAAGVAVVDVEEVTGFPEMMDGRVKTLHPKVHGGLLALRDRDAHAAALEAHGIGAIDLLVANLYPFEQAVADGADRAACVETIDVGGPAMIRAAAKNHAFVCAVTDPADYRVLFEEMDANGGGTSTAFRARMALAAFGLTAAYDAAISNWMAADLGEAAPRRRVFGGRRGRALRYGENPQQSAALYLDAERRPGAARAQLRQGREPSYNNLNDADAAFELACEFGAGDGVACVIVKHAGPCGAAIAATPAEAYSKAFDCDRTSAFGGVVALNAPLDAETAQAIAGVFTEVVIAPEADGAACEILKARQDLRLMITGGLADPACGGFEARRIAGGHLVQGRDCARITAADVTVATRRAPDAREMADLLFAWKVAKHAKSNAIVFARDGATAGIGAGQPNRLDSARIAARRAEAAARELGLEAPLTQGSVVASDAFFPFADGLVAAIEAGATAAIQPGGSKRDAEVVAAADEAGIAMVLTGVRHFRH